ncbi:MAG: hypothetical protein JNM69_06775 [Archangium sp.]|nr:hypothetical protein [Archangium sp.]
MSPEAQGLLFDAAPSARTFPCDDWEADADGFVYRFGAPLFARFLPRDDARLDQETRVGRLLAVSQYRQLRRLELLGCLEWASYQRVDGGPWRRFPRGCTPRTPVMASVSGFGVVRTAATMRLPRLGGRS